MMLVVDNIHTYYGESHALQGVSLQIEAGEAICLLGRNGAGKSTTLKSIMGITPPRHGSVHFQDTAIHGRSPHRIARKGIALVPEERRIFAGLSVQENLEVAMARHGTNTPQWPLARIFDEYPKLAELRDHDGAHLSGGEQQMLAIARALVTEPQLLLLDEPNEGLAPVIVQQIGALMDRVAETTTLLFTDQNLHFALRHAQRGYILQKGQVVYAGTSREIRDDPDVQERYLTVA